MTECFVFDINHPFFEMARKIRYDVFVAEQGVDSNLEFDGHDDEARHYLMYYNGKPVAAARVRHTDNGKKLERFAVMAHCRKMGLGRHFMSFIMDEAGEMYFHSQLNAVPFYEKAGFETTGDLFFEAGIPHYKMILKNEQA